MPDLTERWVASPNTDVGGWQVRTASGGPVADMVLTEEYARRIADLHNATTARSGDLVDLIGRAIHSAVCDGHHDRLDDDDEAAAVEVLAALQAAGRLLPEGEETRTEWGVAGTADFRGDPYVCRSQQETERSADYQRRHGYPPAYVVIRTAHEWPDGSSFVGPWVAVDQETTDG